MGERVQNAEIAFFGGSFTAIDPDYRLALLKTAHAACETYGFAGIRCSTRPDAIDDERLTVLKQYGVTAIELGAQSMDGEVLLLNRRGHTAKDVENAARLIRAYGFELGLQMMTGLPGDSDAKAMKTVERLLALKPNTMRIYPTIVLEIRLDIPGWIIDLDDDHWLKKEIFDTLKGACDIHRVCEVQQVSGSLAACESSARISVILPFPSSPQQAPTIAFTIIVQAFLIYIYFLPKPFKTAG